MKERIHEIVAKGGDAIRSNPVELFILLFIFTINCLLHEKLISGWGALSYYLPVLLLISYTLNQFTSYRFMNWIYAASGLLVFPFFWSEQPKDFYFYWVAVGVSWSVYFISKWQKENTPFVESVLRFARSMVFAFALVLITELLLISIYESIKYIFEIWEKGDKNFFFYSPCFVFMIELPLLFLFFHHDKTDVFKSNKLTEILLNYILSPVLLIYTGILYIYFIKIAVLWSLPKGNVALIVIFFSIAMFALKGCVPLAKKCLFAWFYNRTSWIVLPAQVLFWVGTIYRISEYGFTEARVYLVLTGVVITATALMFFTERGGRYLYVVSLAVVVFGMGTYIPGITAKNIGRISQERRGPEVKPATKLPEFVRIKWLSPIQTEGYKSVNRVYSNQDSQTMYLHSENDSLFVYDKGDILIYQIDLKTLLSRQMQKAGLTHTDTIPAASYSKLLQIELDSALLVLDRLILRDDSVYTITKVEGGFYFKK